MNSFAAWRSEGVALHFLYAALSMYIPQPAPQQFCSHLEPIQRKPWVYSGWNILSGTVSYE